MPTALTPSAMLLWFMVGFVTGLGWSLAYALVSRIVR